MAIDDGRSNAGGEAIERWLEQQRSDDPSTPRRERLARLMIDELFQFVGLLDVSGAVLDVNRSALEAIAAEPGDVLGRPFWEAPWWAFSTVAQAQLRDAIARAAAGEFVRMEVIHRDHTGALINVDFSLKPLFDAEGRVILLLPEGRENTALKRAEQESARKSVEIGQLYAQLKEHDEQKSQFFANVSHELRTPLALILGHVGRLLSEGVAPAIQRDLEVVERNGLQLLHQVNDLLDLARLSADRVRPRYVHADLAHLVQLLCAQFQPVAAERQIRLAIDVPDTLFADVDAERMQQIVLNLVSNALKFTPREGTVVVRLEAVGPDRYALSVADSGPGIPSELREKIFDRFFQTDSGAARRFGGAGLGLTIARDSARLLDAQLTVGEAAEGGARFLLSGPRFAAEGVEIHADPLLPLGVEPRVQRPPPRDPGLPAPRELPAATGGADRPTVLVCEDHPDMNRFLVELLSVDYAVVSCHDGREGLRLARARLPDLVVSDVMMPHLSGDQLLEKMRADPALESVPVVLLTAREDASFRTKALRMGAQDYVTKPFSPEELLARVANLIQQKQARDVLSAEVTAKGRDLASLAVEVVEAKREVERALAAEREARTLAEQANLVKTDFLHLASHELRGPLTALGLRLQALGRADSPTDDERRRAIAALDRSFGRMTGLVDSLLAYAEVDAGRLAMHPVPVRLDVLVTVEVERIRGEAEQKALTVAVTAPSGLPLVHTDPALARLVVTHLLSNAVKFTSRGGVTVRITSDPGGATVEVEDTGPGIPAELASQIFEPFSHVAPIARKHLPGLGLGLAVARSLCAALGATLAVVPAEGGGSRFTVLFPAGLAEAR